MASTLTEPAADRPPHAVDEPFVGRERELAALHAALAEAGAGHGRLLLVVGEAGIGKTRIAEELAGHARAQGAEVLVGRCREGEGAPAYWPWIEALGSPLHEPLVGASAEVAPLPPGVPALEPDAARYRLFHGLITSLESRAAARALMIVLDDLHSADRPSLLLLQLLARALRSARMLVVGTYRDAEYGRDHPLAHALGELVREPVTRHVALARLTEREVADYVEAMTGAPPSPRVLKRVYGESEGNPFFMGEVVRLMLAETGAGAARPGWHPRIPRGARAVIARRLNALSADTNATLSVASVLGREFGLGMLRRVGDVPPDRLLRALGEALSARVIADVPGVAGRYRFSHALIREALHEELSLARRTDLHRQIAETLEHDAAPDVDTLAHHFFEAARGGVETVKAVHYARLAAARAERRLAWEDATAHYQHALEVLDLMDGAPATERIELLLASGGAQRAAGDPGGAHATFGRALDLARALGSGPHLARAWLGLASGPEAVVPGAVDRALVALAEEALAALDPGDGPLRAAVLARLAAELHYDATPDRAPALAREALAMARRAGDPSTLAFALVCAHFVLWWPGNLAERLAIADETIALARAIGQHELAFRGHVWRLTDVFELGDVAAVDVELAECARLADVLKAPFFRSYPATCRAARALLAGRFEESEQQALEAMTLGQQAESGWAEQAFSAQMLSLRREQGRLAEFEPAIRAAPEETARRPVFRSTRALVQAELGDAERAREDFEAVAAGGFATLRHDQEWLICVVFLSEVCAFLGDARRAGELFALLRPYAGRAFVIGNAVASSGAIDRNLGLLAATMERWDDAAHHFEAALDMNVRMEARPFLARTQYAYACMLRARNAPGDATRAGALLLRALEVAQEIGMQWLAEKILAMRPEATTRRASAGPRPAPTERPALFLKEGDFWTVGHPGSVFRLRDALGLRYLALLLRHPGRQFAAVDLAAAVAAAGASLPAQVTRARRLADQRAAARNQERARINVTRAIRTALDKIAANDPSLARSLGATVRTGTSCCHTPDPRVPIAWKV